LPGTDFPLLREAPSLFGDLVNLTPLTTDLVSARYVDWMNDYEIVKFTESRYARQTQQSITDFIQAAEAETSTVAWAILAGEVHIGNIKLGPVDWHHNIADVGLIIGSKAHWGLGYGTQSIKLVVEWAFRNLQLHKITAGFYDENQGSVRAFEKAGFVHEARQSAHYLFEGRYIDRLNMATFNPSSPNHLTES